MLSIKEIKLLIKSKKARDQQGLFITEGRKLFEEAPKDRIVQVLMTEDYEKEHPSVFTEIPTDVPVLRKMEKGRFASLSDTKSPQGILTVVRKQERSIADVMPGLMNLSVRSENQFARSARSHFAGKTAVDQVSVAAGDSSSAAERNGKTGENVPFFVVLENLQDPGNAGTILRTAEAAGVTAVFLTKGSVDLYSPKTIRSTMGSIYRVPHFYVDDLSSLFDAFRRDGVLTCAAHLRGERPYTACDFTKGTALIVGNEGNGITDETANMADVLMKIPMSGQVESLNAAMAAGILMYEVRRQRQ